MALSRRSSTLRAAIGSLAVLGASALAARSVAIEPLAGPVGQESVAEGAKAGTSSAMASRVERLMRVLDGTQAASMRTGFEDPERRSWAFGPVQRTGLNLTGLDKAEREHLDALLDTALSSRGMAMWREVQALETVLHDLESTPEREATSRNPDLYWLRVYGTPGDQAPWSWRFEGHHFALHVTCKPESTPTVTPFFVGANPLFVQGDKGQSVGVGLFSELQRLDQAVILGLGEEAAVAASPGTPRRNEVHMVPGTRTLPAALGVDVVSLPPTDQARIQALLDAYQGLLEPNLRTADLDLAAAEPGSVRFARWGAYSLMDDRTWTLVTPTFALELATTDGPHHVHALLRDTGRDFGGS